MNDSDAIDRYLTLTAIAGRSGEEKAVAETIVEMLTSAGLDDDCIGFDDAGRKTDPPGNVGNLIVTLPGDDSKPRMLLSAHMDTVPICVGCDPHRVGNEIHSRDGGTGLGADDRAGCAAVVTAIIERLRQPSADHPPMVAAFLIQEEIGLRGARHLDGDRVGAVDHAINFDGGDPSKMTIGAIGGERMTIRIDGVPSHAGVAPESGVSAIVIAAAAIADLHAGGWLGRIDRDGGTGTANVGVITGGDATNVITPRVDLRAEARSHDDAFRSRIVATIEDAFAHAAAAATNDQGQTGKIHFVSHVDYEAFRLPDDHPTVRRLAREITAIGRDPSCSIGNGGLDANWLYQHGIESITIGCGQRDIHTANERLDIPDYLDACRIATALVTDPGPAAGD